MNIQPARCDGPQAGRFVLQAWSENQEAWNRLAGSDPDATLYHDQRWLHLLERSYGFELSMASVTDGSTPSAACVLARNKNPFYPRLAALPFSDSCLPLAVDAFATELLFDGLLSHRRARDAYEIRGIGLPPPWRVVNCFSEWKLDLGRSPAAIERRMAPHFRRQLRHASKAGLSVRCSSSLNDLYSFYRLLLEGRRRQGVPVQSLRFFLLVRKLFSPGSDFEIWSLSKRSQVLASVIILRSFGCLHYKWGARRADARLGATHLLIRSVIEKHAGAAKSFELGRTDARNTGLVRFKAEAGAEATPLPYSFYPKASGYVSPEVLFGFTKALSQAWRRLPLTVTRFLSLALYRYMA